MRSVIVCCVALLVAGVGAEARAPTDCRCSASTWRTGVVAPSGEERYVTMPAGREHGRRARRPADGRIVASRSLAGR